MFPVPWYILLLDMHGSTCVLCNLIIFFNSTVFSKMQSRMAKHAFSTFFFAKKRTASTSKKDKIVTTHKLPCVSSLSFFVHGINENVTLAILIAWS